MHISTNSYGTVMFDRTFRSYFGSDPQPNTKLACARPLNENIKIPYPIQVLDHITVSGYTSVTGEPESDLEYT